MDEYLSNIESRKALNKMFLIIETELKRVNPPRRTGEFLISTIKKFIKDGGDINQSNIHGNTLLIDAFYSEKLESARILLEYGADPNIPGAPDRILNEPGQTLFFEYINRLVISIDKIINLQVGINPTWDLPTDSAHQRYKNVLDYSINAINLLVNSENIIIDDASKRIIMNNWKNICIYVPGELVVKLSDLIGEKIPQTIDECRERFREFPVKGPPPALKEEGGSGDGGGPPDYSRMYEPSEGEREDSIFEYNYGFQQGVKYALEYLSK